MSMTQMSVPKQGWIAGGIINEGIDRDLVNVNISISRAQLMADK